MKKMNRRNKARITSKEATRQTKRRLLLESLEDRRLLAGSPELVSVVTNAGDHLHPTAQRLDYSPAELVFNFNAGANLDPSTLGGISIVSSGSDGIFATANVQSDLGTSGEVLVHFQSQIAGDAGNDIKLLVSKSDHGNASGPYISIDQDDAHTILVDLNTNVANPSTATQLVDAINDDADASKLIVATITGGDADAALTGVSIDYSPLHMNPTDDHTINSGYVGLNDSTRDIVFRFSDSIEEGKYRILIPGTGPLALRDVDGTPFNRSADSGDSSTDGEDLTIQFEVELGARVLAVVPQPVVQNNGLREQLRDTVFVYFNNDDLESSTASDPSFYQLVYTNDTIENTDDVVINPVSVDYSIENDLAQLTFSDDLDRLVAGGGTYRMRVGESTPLPAPPLEVADLAIDAGDEFIAALDIGQSLQVDSDGTSVDDGDEFGIELSDGTSRFFEFDRGWEMTVSGTGPLLGETFEISNDSGATSTVFEFISDTGSVSDAANIAVVIDSSVTPTPQLVRDAIQLSVVSSGLVADVGDMGNDSVHLGWESNVVVSESASNITLTGTPGVDSPGATPVQYRSDYSQRQIADAIASTINSLDDVSVQADVNEQTYTGGAAVESTTYRVSLSGAKQIRLSDLRVTAGGDALIDGAVISATSSVGEVRNFEIDLGNVLELPDASTLEAKVLSITQPDANGDPVTSEFEFDTNGSVTSGRTHVLIAGDETPAELAATIKAHVEGVIDDMTVTYLGGSEVQFGDSEQTTFDGTDASFIAVSTAGLSNASNRQVSILGLHSKTSDDIANEIGAAIAADGHISDVYTFNSSISVGNNWSISLDSDAATFAETQAELVSNSFESIRLTAQIGGDADAVGYPGAIPTPGHRDIPTQSHLIQDPDNDAEIPVYTYSFPVEYGEDANGNVLINAITDAQRKRVREVFDLYSHYLGVSFVEQDAADVDNSTGIKVAVGDMVALKNDPSDTDPSDGIDQTTNDTQNKPGGTESVAYRQSAGIGTLILDYQDFQDPATERFGESFFREVMYRVGYILGLGHSDELAGTQIQGDEDLLEALTGPERIFPGSQDIRHGQILYRPDGNDIDVYNVTLDSTGTLDIEILAERLTNPSALDAVVSVYRDGELIGRNDAYFSDDPRLHLEDLAPGQYTIAVSANGNSDFDLNVPGTGRGGTSTGSYELNVVFTEARNTGLTDTDGARLDGDLDGLAGGSHDTWHRFVSDDAGLAVKGNHLDLEDGDWIRITDATGTASAFVVDRTGGNTGSNIISVIDGMTESEFIAELQSTVGSVNGLTTSISTGGDSAIVYLGGVRKVEVSTQAGVLEYIGRNIFVAKDADGAGDGSLAGAYAVLSDAVAHAQQGDVIRVLANAGDDADYGTLEDNQSYQLGFSQLNGSELEDGAALEIPKGVVVVVDAGSIFKMRRSRVSIGSSSPSVDRSGSALQVLGAPYLVSKSVDADSGEITISPLRSADGSIVDGTVYFTSIYDEEIGVDSDPYPFTKAPSPSDWGGLDFRQDIDREQSNRIVTESQGLFLDMVNQVSLRYGGGSVIVDGVAEVVNPIAMRAARPHITNSQVTLSGSAALSATPDSFREDTFRDSLSQSVVHTPNYDRVGPWIRGNEITENSINGLVINVATPIAGELLQVTQSTRWDDNEVVHVLPENLQLAGNVGGLVSENVVPPTNLVTVATASGGTIASGNYAYRITYVDALGNETPASDPVLQIATTAGSHHSVQLDRLPEAAEGFVARRIYRSEALDMSQWGSPGYEPDFYLVGEINQVVESFTDDGSFTGGKLDSTQSIASRPRLHGSLVVDPGLTVKLDGARIDALFGSHFFAEGTSEHPVVFTSLEDQRFGGSGSFDTRNAGAESSGVAGQWGGVYVGPTSLASIDYARIAYGGGTTREQGTFATFNAVELHQGDLRLANSVLESNATGIPNAAGDGSQANALRGDFSTNEIGVVFVRGAQPIIVNNIIRDNWSGNQQLGITAEDIPAINIDVNSLNAEYVSDSGRRTVANFPGGPAARRFDVAVEINGSTGNQGPWIEGNVLQNNDINGLLIRGGTVTAAGVWDDTDITHVMTDEILVPDTHISGGLRLESSPYESLVVKAYGDDARVRAIGRPLDITDRIGGTVHIVGQPRRPVIITSVLDCTEGAGYLTDGSLQVHVDNSGACDADATAPIGNSGAVVVDGGDRDDHGSALDGPDGTAGTADDLNQDGWLYIEQLMAFAINGSRNNAPNDVLAIGIDPASASWALAAITSASVVNGHSLDFAFGAQISTVNFNDYKAIYIPSSEGNVSGGIPDADSLLLATRKDEIREFINNGGSHVALTQATVPNPYAWLELPDQFVITDFGGGGISYDLRKTQAAIDAGITISDADLSWGTPYHNDFVGPPGFNGLVPFVMDEGDDQIAGNADDRVIALGLGSGSFGLGVTPGGPGDWDGIYLDQFSHDTNVLLSTERERIEDHLLGELNDEINGAQSLGNIARDEYASDENARLGFTVLGNIAAPEDIDTYSFRGETGAEVWLDIDRTAATLDTVLEIVDPQGNVIARSDNSADQSDPWHDDTRVADHHVNSLAKSAHGIADQYSQNPGDAGMRVVLPGTPASINTYYVRVYSSGQKSTGNYELSIRVREQDLIAGSTIQYADMRFGVNAVTVSGQPAHSPLVGESIEGDQASNDETIAAAQSLGNILNSDRATLSVAGSINSATDVDWYGFDVQYDSLYDVDKAHYDEDPSEARFVSVTIDVDYANGLGGPDTAISLFRQIDGGGVELVAIGEDSNIADDQAAPMSGNDLDDLSRGSAGVNDGYIGPLALTEGSYFLAVYPESMISEEQLQTLSAAAANPAVRIEPMPHFADIVDRVSDPQDLTQPTGVLFDADSIQPLHLGDVPLFITQGWGPRTNANPVRVINGVVDRQDPAADQTNVWAVDPLTGLSERRIENDGTMTLGEMQIPCGTLITQTEGTRADTLGSFRDVATRQDGSLFGYTVTDTNFVGGPVVTPQTVEGGWSDEQAGDYHQFDLSNCTSTFLGEDNIETHEPDGFGATDSVTSNAGDGHGIQFEALTFGWPAGGGVTTPTGLAVGNRPAFTWVQDADGNWERQLEVHEGNIPHYQDGLGIDQELDTINLLYRFNVQTGDVVSAAPGDRGTGPALNEGAGTNKREIMQLVTDVALDPQATRAEMVLFDDATNVIIDSATGIGTADWEVHDRDLVPVDLNDDGIADLAFQFNSGPDVRVTQSPEDDQYVVDGDRFFIDGQAFEVNTGATLVVNASNGTAVQRGYFDVTEDARYANPQTYRFHLRHANAPGRLPGSDITGGNSHNIDIIIPFSTSITREQIATIITDKIQNAFVDGNSNGIRDNGEAEFRVRAVQHTGENSQHRIILEFDTGDVNISPAYTRTGRILDDVSISPLDSCVSQTLCVHGDSSLKDENAASAGNDYNGEAVVEIKYVGGSQVTEFDDGEADDFWGQVEENTTRDNLIEAIKTATNGGTADWMRVGVGTVNTITVFSDVVVPGGDTNQPKSADSAGDRLNFTNFTYATDTDGYPYAVAPAQDGFDELFDRGVFSLDFNGDGFVDAAGDEVMRNGAVDTSFTYLSAKETELRNRRPNDPLVPLGISSLQPSDIIEVDFGADWTGVDLAQEVSDALMALAGDSTSKIAQDEVTSDVTGAVVQIYDVLNDSGVTFGWDTHNDLNSDGNVDPGEIEGHAKFMVTDDPHHLGGPAPGGLITGLAWIYQTQTELDLGVDANSDGTIDNAFVSYQPRLFAVSDSETDTSPAGGARSVGGGLFEITDPLGTIPGVPTALEYVPTAFNLRGINFQGLVAGPAHVEDGKYAETLFAIDAEGVVYAFDTDGNFQSVFASGQSSVDTGLKNANGLAFGNLDYNLWHFTDTRGTDAGHGVNASSLTNQAAQDGGTSLYFGFEDLYVNDVLDSANAADAARLVFDNPNILDQAGRGVGAGTYDFAGGASGSLTTKPFSLDDYSNGDAVHLFFNYLLETEDASGDLDPSTAAGYMADSFRAFISVDDGQWQLLSTNNAFECDEEANPNSCTNTDDEFDMGNNVRETFDTAAWRQAMIDLSDHVGNSNVRLRFDFATGGAMSTGDVTLDSAGQPIYPVGGQELILKPGYELADGDTVTIDGETFEFDLGYTLAIPAGASLQAGDGFTVTYKIGYDDASTTIDDRISVTESFLFVETAPGWSLSVNRAATGEVIIPFDSGQTAKEVTATAESIMKLALDTLILPTTGTNTIEGGLLAENNGTIATAVVTPLVGGNFNYHAHGEIGDVPDDINTPGDDSLMDVDLIQMDPRVGDVIDVKVAVNVPPTGDYLQPALRFFDASGAVLNVSVDSTIVSGGGVGSDVLEVTARVIAPKTGKIYLGISSIGNESYDAVGGGGTTLPIDPATGLPRQVGQYDLSIETQDPDWPVIRYANNQLQIVTAEELTLHGPADSKLSASGLSGATLPGSGNSLVDVRVNMSAEDVAESFKQAYALQFANGENDVVKGGTNSIFVIGHEVTDAGDFSVNGLLPGEAADNFYNNNTAANNQFEGVYIDDVFVAPTERGMLVTAGANATAFVANPVADADLITTGTYQIEVRRSFEYGGLTEADLDGDGFDESFYASAKQYHTNDRFTDRRSLVFPDGASLHDGLTFTISDGVNSVTFEFEDTAVGNGVASGNQVIAYSVDDTDGEVALAFADAMNSDAVQAILDIKAAGQDFGGATQVDETASNVINLIGNALFIRDGQSSDGINTSQFNGTAVSDGLLGYYRLDGNAIDDSGNGNHGTLKGAIATNDRNGLANAALDFDGEERDTDSDLVELPQSATFALDKYTISTWFKWESDHPDHLYRTVIGKSPDGYLYNQNYMILVRDEADQFMDKHTAVALLGGGTSNSEVVLDSGVKVDDGNWHHAALTFDIDAGTAQFYVDGQLRVTKDGINAIATNSSAPVTVGSWWDNPYGQWDGGIDELRIYDRALNSSEIQSIYHETLPVAIEYSDAETDGINAKQFTATANSDGENLVSSLLPSGSTFSNVSVTAGDASIGVFDGGHDVIGMASGVVLSTGDVTQIGQPNTDTELSGDASGVPSTVIDSELGVSSTDSTTLSFDFVAQGTSLFMNAVFASEEYPQSLAYGESDKVAVFIDDPDTSGTTADFAVVEPTIGVHVSSSEVNNGTVFGIDPKNGHLYKDNSVEHSGPALNDFHSEGNTKREVFGFDGYTSVMRLEANGLTVGKTYRMTISIADVGDETQDSALFIESGSVAPFITFGVDRDSVIGGINWSGFGDLNIERLQGQIVIDSNTFTSNESFGVNVEAGPRSDARVPLAGDLPHPGGARNLGAGNPEQLAPGVVITNNVFADNEAGQLRVAGAVDPGNGENGVVPFSRVVNNTIVGGTDGTARPGIVVENNASPTILNNIIAFTTTGIAVDGTSDTTVVGANVYGNNGSDVSGTVAGDFSITTDGDTLFTNLGGENFYPAAGAASIDASMDSLQDRLSLKTLRESIGIDPSPILAPTVDRYGQLRVDDPDVATPTGLGLNVFKDRGAVDRADTVGPSAYLIMPRDNDRGGLDQNASADRVKVDGVNFSEFRIRLVDNLSPITTQYGAGIADESVAFGSVDLFKYEGVNLETLESCNCSLSEFTSEKLEHGVDYEFQYDATNNVIILNSLAGTFESNQLYAITVRSGDGTVLEIPNGIDLPDETYVDITDTYGETVRFEYDSGYVLQMPEAATLVLPDADSLTTLDRTSFEVSGIGGSVTFEFDTDNSVFGSNVAVSYDLNATALEIADAAATAMNNADLNLFARAISLDDGEVGIHVGANRDQTITLGNNSPLTQVGLPGAIDHHDSVIVDNGATAVEFFFSFETAEDQDTAFEPTDTVSAAVPILVRHDMTQEDLAQALASAIANADLGLSPAHVEDGLIDVGGTFNHKIDLSNAVNIGEVGVPGLANSPLSIRVLGHSGLALAEDGDTFQVANAVSGVTVTYEFDSDGSVADANAVAVNFTDQTTVGELVNEIVIETNNTGLGLEAYKSGTSVVAFKDSTGVTVTVGNSDNAIEAIGTAGLDPAVGVVYSISDNSSVIATATAGAISNVEGILFDDVAAVSGVDSVTITGADQVVSSDMAVVNVVNRAGVRDNAGNSILPNGTDGLVTFLIEAGVEFDYGDAPSPYATSKEDGGPSHIVVNGFSLGDSISTESNAVSDDLDDGVTFVSALHGGYTSEVVVDFNNDAGMPMGMLDAWIDFDRDNVFEDNEKIITAHRLDEGLNTITIATPEHTFPGSTYARFRMSSRGGSGPLGVEMDGEVEDYQVTIHGNPWVNPFEPTDVNRDGHITPIDALMVINHLNDLPLGDTGRLPVPIPEDFKPEDVGYLDVNDNGYADPLDALRVINKLNEIFAEGEDAAEGEFSNLDDVIAAISYDVEEARDSDESDHDDFFAGL